MGQTGDQGREFEEVEAWESPGTMIVVASRGAQVNPHPGGGASVRSGRDGSLTAREMRGGEFERAMLAERAMRSGNGVGTGRDRPRETNNSARTDARRSGGGGGTPAEEGHKRIELGVAGAAAGHEATKESNSPEMCCPICYDEFDGALQPAGKGGATTKNTFSCPCCRVKMHKNCVRRWFQAQRELRSHAKQDDLGSCPTCRYPINWDVIIPNIDRKSNKVKPEGGGDDVVEEGGMAATGARAVSGESGIGAVSLWEPPAVRSHATAAAAGQRVRVVAPPSSARAVQEIDDDTAAAGCMPWSWHSSWSWWGSTRSRRVHVS